MIIFALFSFGLAGHRTSSNQNSFKKPLVVAYFEVDYVKNVKGTNYWRNRYGRRHGLFEYKYMCTKNSFCFVFYLFQSF